MLMLRQGVPPGAEKDHKVVVAVGSMRLREGYGRLNTGADVRDNAVVDIRGLL